MTDKPVAPESLLKVIRCNCQNTSKIQCGTMLCMCRKNGCPCSIACGEFRGLSCKKTHPALTRKINFKCHMKAEIFLKTYSIYSNALQKQGHTISKARPQDIDGNPLKYQLVNSKGDMYIIKGHLFIVKTPYLIVKDPHHIIKMLILFNTVRSKGWSFDVCSITTV